MDITSYEISKKLKEIGFEDETHIYWKEIEGINLKEYWISFDTPPLLDWIPAYGLGTLVSKLPYVIFKGGFNYFFKMNQYCVAYVEECAEQGDLAGIVKEGEESLADLAGLMFIHLYEKELILINKD